MPRKIKKIKKIKLKKKVLRQALKAQLKKPVEIAKVTKPSFLEGSIKKIKIGVIGIGGGGGSIVSEISQRIKRASFFAINSDLKAFKKLPKEVITLPVGQNLTRGLGTGMERDLAEEVIRKEREKIKEILKEKDLCIFLATLGGGFGSGASPVLARVSKRLGNLNLGIFTLPFKFEGEKKMEIARESLEKLKGSLNAIIILSNDAIFQSIDKKTPLREALSVINKNLADSLESLIEIIYLPGIINLDFADLRAIFEGKGKLAYLNTIKFSTSNKIEEEIKKLIFSPLYPYTIKGANGILFNITGGKNLSLGIISEISRKIWEMAGKEAKIIFGVSYNKKLENEIKITLLATGCQPWIFPKKQKEIKSKSEEIRKVKYLKVKKELEVPIEKKLDATHPPPSRFAGPLKVRRNALQIKEEAKKEEEEILAKEKIWETPAFLRKKKYP